MDTLNIPCIYLKQGKAVGDFFAALGVDEGQTGEDPIRVAEKIRDREDASALMVFDFSDDDASHEAAIGNIRDIVRTAVLPVYAAGNIQRPEDVKKLLYAGCYRVVLNFSKDSNRDMLEEVSKRFGRQKIGVYISDYKSYMIDRELIESYAGLIFMNEDEDEQEKLLSETELPVMIHINSAGICREYNSRPEGGSAEVSWSDLKIGPDGLVPCVVQDYRTGEVLMLAYMNEEAFRRTIETGRMTYWSRSRQEIWVKGLTSGHFQFVKALSVDCDNDTLLAKVAQVGAACHTGNYSCFYRDILKKEYEEANPQKVLEQVYQVIADRKANPKEGSYTNYLFDKGLDKILKKLGEESTEIVIAAKNPDPTESVYEISDFLYHCMVLMVQKGLTWDDIAQELARRE